MCLYPKLIKNPKYTKTKKNKGIIPPIKDKRVLLIPVGCQKCIECRNKKAREWMVRLLEEVKDNNKAKFVTLTFNNESIYELTSTILNEHPKDKKPPSGYELDNAIATLGIRRFLERWRKKTKKSVKHWLVTELGHNGTENIHLHGIIWSENENQIKEVWKYGYVYIGTYVNETTVKYIIKYVTKADPKHTEYMAKILTSQGIGKNYTNKINAKLNKYKPNKTDETYTTHTGHKTSLPIYYRNKIYTEEEKEKLWLEKLDKEERWILGVKIDVSKGYEGYDKMLQIARSKNAKLGYGTDEKDWDEIEYQKQRRELLIGKRIEKINERKKKEWLEENGYI